jgi:hypothetical protein
MFIREIMVLERIIKLIQIKEKRLVKRFTLKTLSNCIRFR